MMCLIAFGYRAHLNYPLVVAANRDEYYARPTAPAGFWEDSPGVLAGRDLEQMGTWMGVTRDGRFAALTNYREPEKPAPGKRSRGEICRECLTAQEDPRTFLARLSARRGDYASFNVVLGGFDALFYYSSRRDEVQPVEPGIHALSNHLLDTGWPKVVKVRRTLESCLARPVLEREDLFAMLADDEKPADDELPDTGAPFEWERALSPVFVRTPVYGTRSSTALIVDIHGEVTFVERTFVEGRPGEERQYRFRLPEWKGSSDSQ